MAVARLSDKVFIIKKEAVRGTAEAAAAGGRSLPLLPGSEVNFVPALLADGKLYGDAEERPAQGGIQVLTGTAELEPSVDKLGEFLLSMLGAVATDQPDIPNSPLVYRHRFTRGSVAENPLYTLFVDRKTHQKKYEGVGVAQMVFTVPVDGRVAVTADLIGKRELPGAVLVPDFANDLANLLFSDAKVYVGGGLSTKVRTASLTVSVGMVAKRVLNMTRTAVDILAARLAVAGTFQMYFEDEAERVKFVDSTESDFKLLLEGQVLSDDEKATLELDCPNIRYSAGPVSEVDGFLVQDFSFNAYRDAAAGYQLRATLINKEVAY